MQWRDWECRLGLRVTPKPVLLPLLCAVVVQLPSCVQLFATPWTAAHQASLSLAIPPSLPKFMSIKLSVLPAFI